MTSHKRINTTEWRKATELTIARGAPCVSLHAQDMRALLDELDATHEARKEAQAGAIKAIAERNRAHIEFHQKYRKAIDAYVEPVACTCPSGDGSLRWPCPTHPPESVA